MRMQIIDQFLQFWKRKALRIKCEDMSSVHIVNVGPHDLQRYLCLTVIIDNFCNLIDISIPVTTLVEAESPIRHHGRQSHDIGDLMGHVLWGWTCYKIEVEDTSKHIIFQILPRLFCVVDLDVHTIAVHEKDTMCAILTSVVEVEWVVTVQVRASWNAICVSAP